MMRAITVLLIALVVASAARAQESSVQLEATPRVLAVRSSNAAGDTAGLGDRLLVKVEHWEVLWKQRPIKLFIAGHPAPLPDPQVHRDSGELEFRLVNDGSPEAKKFYRGLLQPAVLSREVTVSVGQPQGPPLEAAPTAVISLRVLPPMRFAIWIGLVGLILAVLVLLARRTNMLRNTPLPGEEGVPQKFSLARAQMAFWSIVVLVSYLFIWLVTNEIDSMTSSAVALLGISSATALAAVVIDTERTANVTASSAAMPTDGAVVPVADPANTKPRSHFLTDILSDNQGISLHRFQMAVWTIVLGIVFIRQTYETLAMPEFSATLLALMGVSAGTYVGFKFPEQRSTRSAV